MSTQRRNRGASRQQQPQGLPGALPFAGGLVTGVLLTLALMQLVPEREPAPVQPQQQASEENEPQESSDFQFYTLLNEIEVPVPLTSSESREAEAAEETVYWLQVASFRSREDADQLRASLLLLNLEPHMQQVNIQGNIWHRVVVGPYESRTNMASARQRLLENGHQPMLLPPVQR